MPSINMGDVKKGLKVLIDNEPYEVVECSFRKPGKGAAVYTTKLRNLLKGTLIDKRYRSGETLESADVHRGEGQYLYRDAAGYTFMDNESFEQYTLPEENVADRIKFLKEGDVCGMLYWNGQLIDMTPPQQVILEVTYTEPAAKGDTATNVTKSATVETGAEVQVPAFIAQGDKIKIDIASGAYVERANK